jgi:hypothetical protein
MEIIAGDEAEDPVNNVQIIYTACTSEDIDGAYYIQYLPTSAFSAVDDGTFVYTHQETCRTHYKSVVVYPVILAVVTMIGAAQVFRSCLWG